LLLALFGFFLFSFIKILWLGFTEPTPLLYIAFSRRKDYFSTRPVLLSTLYLTGFLPSFGHSLPV
jgi:hypothetical protein